MLAIAEARAKGLELVARPLKTKVTLPPIALSFVIVICTTRILFSLQLLVFCFLYNHLYFVFSTTTCILLKHFSLQ